MSSAVHPDVLVQQTSLLADDVRELTPALAGQLDVPPARRVVLVGNGDSYHASCAAAPAFASFASVPCEAVPAQRFADYPGATPFDRHTLVVGISASGSSPKVIEAVELAARLGASTLAVTGRRDSGLALAAHRCVHAEPAGLTPGPGVRTHQASLLALLLLAIRLGGHEDLRRELVATADVVARTVDDVGPACRALAPAVAGAPVRFLVGAGPGFGVAGYAAAKLIEAAGVPSFAQDVEEWWHVERFCRPLDIPLFVIATPGAGVRRGRALADRAAAIGRQVVLVGEDQALPVAGPVREEFSPLTHSLFAPLLAAAVAGQLGRRPFLGDLVTPSVRRQRP